MFSNHWSAGAIIAVKSLAFLFGLSAAVVGFWAARLWLEASKVSIPDQDMPAASMDDAPALHILNGVVQLNQIKEAYDRSGMLNARAARWTALAAVLTGVATILGTL